MVAGGAVDEPTPEFADERRRVRRRRAPTRARDVIRAYAPYGIIIAVFVVCQIPAVKSLLDKATFTVNWPGLHLINAQGERAAASTFT